jgi:periplasmic protein TonB
MFEDETHSHKQLERAVPSRLLAAGSDAETQRKRMLLALGILLLALVAVIVKDWDFWFPTRVETPEEVARKSKPLPVDSSNASPSITTHERRSGKSATQDSPAGAVSGFSATTERAALPPLQVEVIAGNQRVSIPARSNTIHVDVGSGIAAGIPFEGTTISPGGVRVSPQAAQNVSLAVPPDYPLLARQMKVQGVVSLQALIAKDGTIQELQILSGPEILAAAAREAVKQWHFKPYLQSGEPVETQARITVNFTISTN